MQVTLLERMMLIRLKNKSRNKVSAGICELLARTFNLPCLSIYAGTDQSLKLLGVYLDQESFNKSFPLRNKSQMLSDPDLTEGLNFPYLLPAIDKEKPYNEIKIQSQPFGVCSYKFESWFIAVVFGGVDTVKRTRIGKDINVVMEYLCSILLPLIMQEKEESHSDNEFLEDVGQKFLLSLMDLRGFLSLCLSLFQTHFNSENASISFTFKNQKYFFSTKDRCNKEFIRDFTFSNSEIFQNGLLSITSSKNIFTSQQTNFVVKVSLYYVARIIQHFLEPRIDSAFYLQIITDLTRIYETLISHEIGMLDINLSLSDFFAKKMQLSEEENQILHWKIGTSEIGKIAIRIFSLSYAKSVEDEYNKTVRNNILKSISMLIENYEIMMSDYSLFRSIEKAFDFYYHFVQHCYSDDFIELDSQLKQSSLPENFKLMLKDKIMGIKNMTCQEFRQCSLLISEICPSKEFPKSCFNQESAICAAFHKRCQECAYYYFQKEKK